MPCFIKQKHSRQSLFPELGETNPFLHLGLHLAIREQTETDRPEVIASIFKQLVKKITRSFGCGACTMECLAEALWLSQKNQTVPNENAYLEACKRVLLDEMS